MRRLICILLTSMLITSKLYLDPFMPLEVEIPDGAAGVWQVPILSINLPLYEATPIRWQETVDRDDCALIMPFGAGRQICDHADSKVGSGVWRVDEMRIDCAAYLITQDGIAKYKCYQIVRANNTGYAYLVDGIVIYPHCASDILCASCAIGDGSEVYVASFRQVKEVEA